MDFIIYTPVRQWLYERRHPIWFSFERSIGWIAAPLIVVGMFLLEAIAALIVGGVIVLPFVRI